MSRTEVKLKRGVFRKGKFRTHQTFGQFKKSFQTRRRRENRIKLLIAMIIVLLLTFLLYFTGRASVEQPISHPEITFENTNQIL